VQFYLILFDEGPLQADLWGGQIQADTFSFTGIGTLSSPVITIIYGEDPLCSFEMRVWGTCEPEATVHFDSDPCHSGSFTANVLYA